MKYNHFVERRLEGREFRDNAYAHSTMQDMMCAYEKM